MLPLKNQLRFWLIAFVLFGLALWILKPVLLPFVTGSAIAYFLDPAVNVLERRKVSRWLGALIVLFSFLLIVGLIFVLIFPLLQSQITALVVAAPGYVENLKQHYTPWFEQWLSQIAPEDADKIRGAASQSVSEAAGWLGHILQSVVSSGFAFIDVMALMIVTPVVAFYLLRDWPVLTANLDSCLPRAYYEVIRAQLAEVDSTLSGFIRGQALVALSLGTIYTLGLLLTGLHYSAAIGVTAGLLSFIPYVGTIFGWVTSLLLGFSQFNDWTHIIMIVVVFFFGHIMEAYVLTPRLVGHRVHLHPVWVLFALIAGAKLMGFTGVLIAVPTAAVIGVLIRFGLSQYKQSAFYRSPPTHTGI